MDPKLTEEGWKAVVAKNKLKDKDLQKALLSYWALEDDDYDWRLKWLDKIAGLATALKKNKEVAALPEVVKYLTQMVAAANAESSEVTKAKAQAAKTKAVAQKKADVEAKKGDEDEEGDDEGEEEEGDTLKKLTTALKTLKLSKKPYYFLVCDVKPYGLMVSKKDIRKNAQAKKDLSQIAGGSTRSPKIGECRCEGGKYVFEMEKPPAGLARILQKWIKDNTGLGLKVMVGAESAEDEEEQPAAGAAPSASSAPAAAATAKAAPAKEDTQEKNALEERRSVFKKARATWIAVKNKAEADLEKVKDGARMQYIHDKDQYPKIAKGCQDIDAILDNLDDKLRDTLDQYASTPLTNKAKLQTLSAAATEVLNKYYNYVANDPIMKAIDKKEFADVTVHAPIMKALGDLRKALA
jgi:hypothetical protein